MVTAIERSYESRRGDAFLGESFRFLSGAGAAFWSNYVVRAQLRATEKAPAIHEFSLSPAVTTEGSLGILTVSLSMTAAQSAAIPPGLYYGDIEVTSASLPTSTLVSFKITQYADITR